MAVLKKEELLEKIKKFDNDSDEYIEFLEDFSDTFDDLEQKSKNTDDEWKRKYKERFFMSEKNDQDELDEQDEEDEQDEDIKIDDLFEEVKK